MYQIDSRCPLFYAAIFLLKRRQISKVLEDSVYIYYLQKKDTKMFFSSFLFSETQQEERLPLRRCEIGSIKLRTIKRSEEVRDISI